MKWIRRTLWIVVLFLVLFFGWAVAINNTPLGAMLTYLPIGWWLFLKRNIPQISFNWGLIMTGVICSTLVLVLGNCFLSALYAQIQPGPQPGEPLRKWRWRWSVGLYASIWLLFLIAFGATGVLRHASWLLSYNQPWYEIRGLSYRQLSGADSAVGQIVIDNDQDFEKTRQSILAVSTSWGSANPLCEDYNIILYGDSSNEVATYLIIPRKAESLAQGEFAVTVPEGSRLFKPISELPKLLVELDAKYPIKASQ